ncbi:MAG TPA: DUF2243 domain-containing protein [Frankiaceae bacterium]|nr:DUF2243 domain-containing protein [Frankiaceae bacterium]
MRRLTVAGLLLGVGLGGFVDGIVLHQVLQWHHLLTDTSVTSIEKNTLANGLFHAATWVCVLAGVVLLWRSERRAPGRYLAGLLLAGWGAFNLVEGVVDHHLLTIHHVRDDVANPLPWDLGFLALSAVLLGVGWALARRSGRVIDVRDGVRHSAPYGEDPGAHHARTRGPVESGARHAGRQGGR